MKNTSLTRSIPYWLLLALSLAAVAVGGWLVLDNTSTMQTTLTDGTATNVEVYVGQAWITAGASILAAGIVGLVLALGLAAAKALIASNSPVVVDETDQTADRDAPTGSTIDTGSESSTPEPTDSTPEPVEGADASEDQNGSSGSIATATKINVK